MMNTLELRSANMFKKIKDAAFRIIRSKWYWILALLAVTVIAFLLLGYKRAAAVLIIGFVAIISPTPEAFFATGIALSALMGVFLAVRAGSLALDTAKVAFAFFAVGTLLGAWRLWKAGREDDRSAGPGSSPD